MSSVHALFSATMSNGFPDPFGDDVTEEVKALVIAGELTDLIIAMDAQINAVTVPQWYQSHRISRIYTVLLELRLRLEDRTAQEKAAALLRYMRRKYRDQIAD
jgi:hypothetical protein